MTTDPGADAVTQLAEALPHYNGPVLIKCEDGDPTGVGRSIAAALLPVVDNLRREAYGQGRDDEAEGAEIPEWAR